MNKVLEMAWNANSQLLIKLFCVVLWNGLAAIPQNRYLLETERLRRSISFKEPPVILNAVKKLKKRKKYYICTVVFWFFGRCCLSMGSVVNPLWPMAITLNLTLANNGYPYSTQVSGRGNVLPWSFWCVFRLTMASLFSQWWFWRRRFSLFGYFALTWF